MKHYSATTNSFYAGSLRADYEAAGTWPADAVEVYGEVFAEFSAPSPAGMQRVGGPDGLPMWAPVPPLPADQRRKAAKDAIDAAAGAARRAFVSVGWGVEEEYRLAKQETDAWIAAGAPADAVPPSIAAWAQARDWTPEQAATDILRTEQLWTSMLLAIREQRLLGKGAVDAAGDDADFDAIAAPFIAALDAIRAQAP